MTKADLIANIAKEAKVPKATVEKVLKSFEGAVTKVVKKGDKLSLTGFVTFSVGRRKARKGRNPQTGEELKIPAMKVVRLKPGNVLKSAVK